MKIEKAKPNRAPIILLYGQEGRGKTTLACKSDKPLAFLLERGLPRGIEVDAVTGVDNFDTIMGALREFYADPQGYRTIVIDTLDAFEAILIDWTCFRNNWKTIESPPFGKGWVAADDTWRNFLRALIAIRDRHNTTIILVCHASIERIDDPRCASFTSYAPKLHRRARGLVADVADAIFFLSEDLRVVTDDRDRNRGAASTDRYLFCQGRPSFMAKNRFGIPEKVPLPVNANFSDIARYWANPTE